MNAASTSSASGASDPLSELMQAVVAGDEAALADLYRSMNRKIYAFALRHVNDADLAEGIVVDTMFEVWKNASRFNGQSSVCTWILGIARHKALDEVRRHARLVPYDEARGMEQEDDAPSAFDNLASAELREQVVSCMRGLPREQQECLHLAFFEDMPLADIARIQDVPENTVKTRLFHARRKLKVMLSRGSNVVNIRAANL